MPSRLSAVHDNLALVNEGGHPTDIREGDLNGRFIENTRVDSPDSSLVSSLRFRSPRIFGVAYLVHFTCDDPPARHSKRM